MAFRGALLKPGEKAAPRKTEPSKPKVSAAVVDTKQTRFEHLKQIVRSGLQTAFEVGAALLEIRDTKLYKEEFDTFEAFCEFEFKIVRARAYQLIEAAQIKESLPPDLSKILDNDAQARALAAVPEEDREEVLTETAEQGPVTAKAIKATAAKRTKKKKAPEPPKTEPTKQKELDKTGYPIPELILEDWKRAESFRKTLGELQAVKLTVEKALDHSDLIFREIGKDTLIELQNAWTNLKSVLPYAVCPTCQGRTRDSCTACKGRGFVSEFGYKHWFPKKTIELRERAIKK